MDDTNRFSSPWKSPCPSNLHYSKRICLVERFASCTMESTTDSRIRAPRPIVCVRDLQIRFHGKSPPPFKSRILWRFFLSLNLPLSADLSLTCENLAVPSPPKVGWYGTATMIPGRNCLLDVHIGSLDSSDTPRKEHH